MITPLSPIQLNPTDRVLVAWSSGKDSAWMLHHLLKSNAKIAALLTTYNETTHRIGMHGLRLELLRAQANALNLPLWEIPLPSPCSNSQYEEAMGRVCKRAVDEGITHVAFGDLFLADIKKYREENLKKSGLIPLFPLWGIPTKELADQMITGGLKTKIISVNSQKLPPAFLGREYNEALLRDLPEGIDPCGENGEFHTFVYGGPHFSREIRTQHGEILSDGLNLTLDLLPSTPII